MLALALGRTVAELERTLSARELGEWQRVMATTPFGVVGEDARHALRCAIAAAPHVKGGKAEPRRFAAIRWPDGGAAEMTPEQAAAMFGLRRSDG